MPTSLSAPSRRTLAILALILLGAGGVLMYVGRELVFFYDEWDFILRRRGVSADVLLDGHNGHLSIVPIALYKLMLATVGLEAYWPYRLLLVAIHLAGCALLFLVLRTRVGDVLALCATAVVAVLGFAADDLVWAFQIGFVGSATAGLGMLLALDRRSPRGDLVAGVLLLVSLACSSIGVPFLVVAIVQLAAERDRQRFLRVVAGPIVLYGAWRLGYGESDLKKANIDAAPVYAFNMLSAAIGGLTGLGGHVGPTLSVAAIATLLWSIVRRPPSPRLLGLLAGALALWGLTALARAGLADPGSARYVYASAILVLLMAAELWPPTVRPEGRAILVAVAVVLVAAVGNLQPLTARALEIRGWSGVIRAQLTAVEIAGERMPAAYQPVPQYSPQILAGQYLSAMRAFGSSAHTEAELIELADADRHTVDETLAITVPPAATPRPAPSAGSCTAAGPQVALPRAGSLVVRDVVDGQPARLMVRRYGDTPASNPIATVADGETVLVSTAADGGERPWSLAPDAPVRTCGAG